MKFNYKYPEVLTAREARKQGVQINDTPDAAFGIKTKHGKKIFVMPPDFVIDRFHFTTLDISHVDFNNKNKH